MKAGILTKFGLTYNDSIVYKGFIDWPNSTAADMARLLRLDKSSTYNAVEHLKEKGLLIPRGGLKGLEYFPANPEVLKSLVRERETALKVETEKLNDLIKNLKDKNTNLRSTLMTVEYGLDAHMKRMEESIVTNNEKQIRESFKRHKFFDNKEYREYVKNYATKRVKKKIKMKQIVSNISEQSSDFYEIMNDHKKFLKEVRIRPIELDDENSIRIYDDTVNIISYGYEDEFIVITIKDKFVAEMMKNWFDFIYSFSENYIPKKS